MIALLLTAAFCGALRDAVKQAERPVRPFAAWKAERQPFVNADLELYRSTQTVPPFASCRVALAKDLSALECELPFDDTVRASAQLQDLVAQAGRCLGQRWEQRHPPLEQKYGLLGISSWKKRALEIQLYAQGPSTNLHLGFPLQPVEKGAVVVLTVTVE
jgi:hypothetical protein